MGSCASCSRSSIHSLCLLPLCANTRPARLCAISRLRLFSRPIASIADRDEPNDQGEARRLGSVWATLSLKNTTTMEDPARDVPRVVRELCEPVDANKMTAAVDKYFADDAVFV